MSNSSEVSSSAGFVLVWQGDLFEGTVQATSLFLDAALDMSLQTSHPGSVSHSTWFLVVEDVQVLLNLYCREPCRWNDGAVRWRNISVARVVACSFHFMCVCPMDERWYKGCWFLKMIYSACFYLLHGIETQPIYGLWRFIHSHPWWSRPLLTAPRNPFYVWHFFGCETFELPAYGGEIVQCLQPAGRLVFCWLVMMRLSCSKN